MSFFSCGLQIRVCEGPDKGRTFPLDSREITVGRARNPGDRAPGWILLNDSKISRIHADLVWSDETQGYQLMHRSETNPTELNGQPLEQGATLKIGDIIRFGGTALDVQQADFRFGGVAPERIGQIHEARRQGQTGINHEFAFRDPKKEVEAEGNTLRAGRKIALSTRPKMVLEILGGSQQGQKLPLSGFQILLGGTRPEELPDQEPWWDQVVEIDEETLPYRSLSLHWRELQNAFEVSFARDVTPSITLERRVDGTEWIAEMPTSSPVVLRPFDLFYIGRTAVQLVVSEG